MKHRHLTEDAAWTLPAIDDILDRGDPSDWDGLANAILAQPFGPVAERTLQLCNAHAMYGTSTLWRDFVALVRSDAERDA